VISRVEAIKKPVPPNRNRLHRPLPSIKTKLKLIGWRVVHSGTSALVAAILILLRAEGNQHLHLWLRKAEVSKIQN
jgi:hypothetical protein